MSIKRVQLAYEKHFTQIPNAWARDKRLTRKARGLLTEIMTHRIGWEITIESLVEGGPEGRDAVSGGINELITYGYLVRTKLRGDGGKFGGIDYEIHDPWSDKSAGQTVDGLSVSGSPVSGSPARGESAAKNTISQEHHLQEDHQEHLVTGFADDGAGFDLEIPASASEPTDTFAAFWEVWPRRVSRIAAEKAYGKALRLRTPQQLLADAITYAAHVAHRPPEKRLHAATWLNEQRWNDDLSTEAPDAPQRALSAQQQLEQLAAELGFDPEEDQP